MKKTILMFVCLLILSTASAQSDSKNAMRDSLLNKICKSVDDIEEIIIDNYWNENYKLYKTENIYTFLRLDTSTGQIDQVQWALDKKDEGILSINQVNLAIDEPVPGTFELYPTSNIYQFILLDKNLGRMWHVQWGIGAKNRWIRSIK